MHRSAERFITGAPKTHGEFMLELGGRKGGRKTGGRDDGIHCVLSGMHHRVAIQGYYIT